MFINHLEYLETLLSKPGVLFAAPVDGIVEPTLTKISTKNISQPGSLLFELSFGGVAAWNGFVLYKT